MKNSNSVWLASFYENKLIGYVNSVCIADEAEINRIAVKEGYRHLGIGKKLLDLTIEKIKQNNCNCIYLEVRENNINAIGLYKKAFFTVCGMRKNYYKNPTENAALMKLIL